MKNLPEMIILAGGFGTRLRPVVEAVPKPLAPIAGKPFLEYLLGFWVKQGIRRFILSVGYRWEKIRAHFGTSFLDVPITYSVESSPLGTGGGLISASKQVGTESPILVANGDTYFEVDLRSLYEVHYSVEAQMTMALARVENSARFGRVGLDPRGEIVEMGKASKGGEMSWINGGVYFINPELLNSVVVPTRPVSLESELVVEWIRLRKRIYGARSSGRFLDIGIPEDFIRAQDFLAA